MVRRHIGVEDVRIIIQPVNIFEVDRFDEEIESIEGEAAKADAIAARVKKVITERMEEDPVLYLKLSELIEAAIQAHREKRLSDADYLRRMRENLETTRSQGAELVPEAVRHREAARAYHNVLKEVLDGKAESTDLLTQLAVGVDSIIGMHKIRNWHSNTDVQNRMLNDIDDLTHDLTRQHGDTVIHYSLEQRERKTLAIEVHPDSSVHVKAPKDVGLEEVQAKVLKRAGWIIKQQRTFESYPPPLPTRQYISGESFRYLGKQYRLKVIEADTEGVKLYRGRLEACVKTKERARIHKFVTTWFRARAEAVFQERYDLCTQVAKAFSLHHDSGFEARSMVKRWGSLTKEGKLILNPQLVSAPKACIDYVITHEFCHLREHNKPALV